MNSYNLRILFIRHAESQANTTPDIIVGRQAESKLTQLGKEQSQLLGQRLQNISNPYIQLRPRKINSNSQYSHT
jgi:broad specificity phosphatase PhoE